MTVMRSRHLKGEITVFLTLLFGIVSALMFIIIESALDQTAKYSIEAIMQIGMHSCFGEYNRDLFDKYNLLAIDTSYRSESAEVEKAAEHLKEYADINFSIAKDKNTSAWMELNVKEAELLSYELLSDGYGGILKDQAVSYMDKYGDKKYSNTYSVMKSYLTDTDTADGGFMDSFCEALLRCEEIENNPARHVYDIATSFDILSICGVSGVAGRTRDGMPSERKLNIGSGEKNNLGKSSEESFDLYLLEHFGDHNNPKDKTEFIYELEYLISGNKDQRECLNICSEKILNQRKHKNLNGLFENEEAVNEAENLATALCAGNEANPTDVMESLMYAWAYAESAIDVSYLLNGGMAPKDGNKVPNIGLSDIEDFAKQSGSDGSGEKYKDYLAGLLGNLEDSAKRKRVMDLIEQNMQHLGHMGFRIDCCITEMTAEMKIGSNLLRDFTIKRDYGYSR